MVLEQNSPDYLISLTNLEVNSILGTLEQIGMYVTVNIMSSQSTTGTPLTSQPEKGISAQKEDSHSQGFRPITWPHQRTKYSSHPKSPTHKPWYHWKHKLLQDRQFIA